MTNRRVESRPVCAQCLGERRTVFLKESQLHCGPTLQHPADVIELQIFQLLDWRVELCGAQLQGRVCRQRASGHS